MLRRREKRQGLALMIVLSLLVLFLLMGISFLMVANVSEKSARSQGKAERKGTSPSKLADMALYQVLREPREPSSTARAHSLLRDMYGPGFSGQLDANALAIAGTGNQFIELGLRTADIPPTGRDTVNYYAGRVLTFTSGNAKGISVRVVGYDPTDPAIKKFHVLRGELSTTALPRANDRVYVNGAAFDGAGFAYDGSTMSDQALKPNRKGETAAVLNNNYLIGGPNESYDAPDFQNMALAAIIPDAAAAGGFRVIPSFHRPQLIQHDPADPKRVLRPLRTSQGGTESNSFPSLADLINGPWDVDNDNDGVPDSIWLDLGLPVESSVDGRPVKPLFAILCVDLDGRLNLNVHGNEAYFDSSLVMPPQVTHQALAGTLAAPAGTPNTSQMPRGFGYGPPEINLAHAFPAADYTNLLLGTGSFAGRYGADDKPGVVGLDALAAVKFFEHPDNYFGVRSTFNSPDDLNGWSAMGLDDFGQARYAKPTVNTKENTPYEINVALDSSRGESQTAAADQPFSVAELERVLRANDIDASALPRRLWSLCAEIRNDPELRKIVTTDSYDVPVAPPIVPGSHILDELMTLDENDLKAVVPTELLTGSRMDINRPFGDGRDNEPDNVFDEPDEFPALNLRQIYAQQLYVLARTVIGKTTTPALTPEQIHDIAQWSVNVVDFRDADSIMTPFEYDKNPFNGWDVDGILGSADDGGPQRGLAWGAERPELLLSETLAWHDRRTYDMEQPNKKTTDGTTPDDHYDQWWIPRGAFFVELFNPWAGDENRPGELHASGGTFTNGVILDKQAPGGAPVWRLSIVKDNKDRDPDDPDPAQRPTAERTVYLVPPPAPMRGPGVFYSTIQTIPLVPGGYAVIGSAGIDRDQNLAFRTNVVGWKAGAPRSDDVNGALPGDFLMSDFYDKPDARQLFFERTTTPSLHHKFGIINNGYALDADWAVRPVGIPIQGLTVSEPIGGYMPVLHPTTGAPLYDTMVNVPTQIDDDWVLDPPHDKPLDLLRFPGVTDTTSFDDAMMNDPDFRALHTIGTTGNFRMIHLQRLANPTQPHDPSNPALNPYLTIDSLSVDLTTFNGAESRSVAEAEKFFGQGISVGKRHHAALQRGDQEDPTNASYDNPYERRQLWKYQVENNAGSLTDNAPPGNGTHLFDFQIRNSLGSLNSSVQFANGGFRPGTAADDPFGFPEIYVNRSATPPVLNNLPTFPLLTWNNRPFVSHYELMLVPKDRSSQMLRNYSVDLTPAAYNPYDSGGGMGKVFGHLPNFFDTKNAPPELQFHRILDYVHVPSRFVGTETVLHPDPLLPANPFNSWSHPLNLYSHVFSKVPTFREPGKVNINTVFDPRVWQALMDGDNVLPGGTGHGGPTFGELVASRRGYDEGTIGGTASDILRSNAGFPTYFANPFRQGKTGDLVPSSTAGMQRDDIECTLLRPFSSAHPDSTKQNRPLFELTRHPNFELLHLDNRRNPVMRNHALTRVANLVTTRSNVYAIWITVGYFEVDPATGQLGAEKGGDTGDVNRHRAFYIIDRSIPVAFEPGENHNVDKCILVRRFIE